MKDEIKEIISLLNSSSWSNEAKQIEDYITNLQEENKKLEREIKIKDAWANEIKCDLWHYDGCENSIIGLRGLVDEAIDKSEKIMNCDDKSIAYVGYNKDGSMHHKNILDEELTEFTERDKAWLELEKKGKKEENEQN